MRPIRVHSTKFNGSHHYRFTASVVDASDECVRIYTPPNTPLDSYRGQLTSKSHSLRLYWPDRHWNLLVRWRPDWTLEDYYVNVATPACVGPEQIDWIDLDLDVILVAAAPGPIVDDEDEFALHAALWSYPTELIDTCRRTVEDVIVQMNARTPPFDGSLDGWRPAGRA